MYWILAPVAELNGQIGPVWVFEPTIIGVIMSVQDKSRRLYIAYDSIVSRGDSVAIIG